MINFNIFSFFYNFLYKIANKENKSDDSNNTMEEEIIKVLENST